MTPLGSAHSDTTCGGVQHRPRVLLADSDETTAVTLSTLLSQNGYLVDVVRDGMTALSRFEDACPDVALINVAMATLDGLDLCQRVKNNPTTRLVPVVLLTADGSRDSYIAALRFGADALLSKPVDSDELLTRIHSLVRTKRYTDDLEPAAGVMTTLAMLMEANKGYSHGHCHRMANFATAVGGRMGLDADDLQILRRGSFLHDIGMLAVPSTILDKPGTLDEREFAIVRSHTVLGDSLVANLRSLQAVGPVVRHHHERLDGSGYPDGLRGDDIPLAAQIVGIVDAFEAMTTRRPYQHLHSVPEALDTMYDEVRRGWRRRDLVDEFVKITHERSQ